MTGINVTGKGGVIGVGTIGKDHDQTAAQVGMGIAVELISEHNLPV